MELPSLRPFISLITFIAKSKPLQILLIIKGSYIAFKKNTIYL
jgi:hypothetical protein